MYGDLLCPMIVHSVIYFIRNLLLIITAIIAFLSCSEKPVALVREVRCQGDALISKRMTYTSSGEMASLVQPGDSGVYTYSEHRIELRRYFSEDSSTILQSYTTDELGRIRNEQIFEKDSVLLSTSTFEYTDDGQLDLIHSINLRTNAEFRFLLAYQDEDPVKMKVFLNNQLLRTFYYRYDPEAVNLLSLTGEISGYPVFSVLNGDSPLGKPAAHLLLERIVVEANGDTSEYITYKNQIGNQSELQSILMKNELYGTTMYFEYNY